MGEIFDTSLLPTLLGRGSVQSRLLKYSFEGDVLPIIFMECNFFISSALVKSAGMARTSSWLGMEFRHSVQPPQKINTRSLIFWSLSRKPLLPEEGFDNGT